MSTAEKSAVNEQLQETEVTTEEPESSHTQRTPGDPSLEEPTTTDTVELQARSHTTNVTQTSGETEGETQGISGIDKTVVFSKLQDELQDDAEMWESKKQLVPVDMDDPLNDPEEEFEEFEPGLCNGGVPWQIYLLAVAFTLLFACGVTGPGIIAKAATSKKVDAAKLSANPANIKPYHWYADQTSAVSKKMELPIYLTHALFCLIVPKVVDYTGNKLGLVAGALGYFTLSFAYFIGYWGAIKHCPKLLTIAGLRRVQALALKRKELPLPQGLDIYDNSSKDQLEKYLTDNFPLPGWIQGIMYTAAVIKGIMSPILWTSFGSYITEKVTAQTRGINNGAFFAIYRLNFIVAASMGLAMQEAFQNDAEKNWIIMLVFTVICGIAVCMFVILAIKDSGAEQEEGPVKVKATCIEGLSAFIDPTMVRVLFTALAISGLTKNWWLTSFNIVLGEKNLETYVNICYGVVCFLASYAFGYFFDKVYNKKWLFYVCYVCNICFLLGGLLALPKGPGWTTLVDQKTKWPYYIISLFNVGIAGVDAMLSASYPLILGADKAAIAYAAHQCVYGVGMAIPGAFAFAEAPLLAQTITAMVVVAIAFGLFWTLPAITKDMHEAEDLEMEPIERQDSMMSQEEHSRVLTRALSMDSVCS